MACILSMRALYTNPFSEGGADIQNKGCESFDFNWINSQYTHSGLSYNQRYVNQCHTGASTSSSILSGRKISNGLSGTFKHEQHNVHSNEGYETDVKANDPEENGKKCVTNLFNLNNKTDVEPHHMSIMSIKSHGVKRKASITESEEIYIPPKRVSPFLNTPKQRKDERKKILKISMKKLKQIDDPEAFLRRTVLVNNITKRLQTELRQEKDSTNNSSKRNSFRGYGVPSNNCMSDSYLIDDPFLSGVHEKITDDMTDTLIKNVFHDKTNAKTKYSEIDEKSNITSNKMDFSDEQPCIDSRMCTSSNISQDSSNQISSNGSITAKQSTNKCSLWNCLGNRTCTQGMSFDKCGELEVANMCSVNTCAENFKTICNQCSGTVNVGESYSNSYSIENRRLPSSEMQNVNSDQNTECDKLQSANRVNLVKPVYDQVNFTDTVLCSHNYNTHLASKSAINGHNCRSEQLEADQKLDQKSVSHSFNEFLSPFDINTITQFPESHTEP